MKDVINTERLALRPIVESDAQKIATFAGDIDVARMTSTMPHPYPVMSAEFFIMTNRENRRRGLCYNYAITQSTNNDLMGVVGLFKRGSEAALELGYWIGKPFWSYGYTTEACQALIKEAKTSLGVTRIVAGVFVDNPASIKVLTKLGFKSSETYENWFSMARMEKAKGINLTLEFSSSGYISPLHESQKAAMRA